MPEHDFAIINGQAVLPGGAIESVNIGARGGKIVTITSDHIDADEVVDAAGKYVIPGVVDEHYHSWWGYGVETHEISSRAAAKGGVTTLVEMPLDDPPTITRSRLEAKLAQVGDQYHVDFAAIGGYYAEDPEEVHAMADAGVVAYKIFTGDVAPPGMFPGTSDAELLDLMRRIKSENLTLLAHCENSGIVCCESARVRAEGRGDAKAWDDARPWFAEVDAVQRVAIMAKVTGARVVVVHVATPEAVDVIAQARREGADIWAETLPHQLCLNQEAMGDDTRLKWNPPTRQRSAVDRLWSQLQAGDIHCIGSDHAPLPKFEGADIWAQSPGAGNVLETMLPIVATEAMYGRGIGLAALVEVFSSTPAKILGLHPRKGAIQIGSDADLVVLETEGSRIIDAQQLEFYNQSAKWSPYDGREVKVYPLCTVVRGKIVYRDGEVVGPLGHGTYLTTNDALSATLEPASGTIPS